MSAAMQLTIDGREVPYANVVAEGHLSQSQAEILYRIGRDGGIRPVDAGLVVHALGRKPDAGRDGYASSDGCDALRRLARRGLVKHRRRGWWVRPDAPRERLQDAVPDNADRTPADGGAGTVEPDHPLPGSGAGGQPSEPGE